MRLLRALVRPRAKRAAPPPRPQSPYRRFFTADNTPAQLTKRPQRPKK